MHKQQNLTPGSRIRSIGFALQGIATLLKQEINMKIHLLGSIAAVAAGVAKGLQPVQWAALILVIGLVWLCEAFNTALEMLCDLTCGHAYNAAVKKIKDIAAGAVLIAALVSIATGIFIFMY